MSWSLKCAIEKISPTQSCKKWAVKSQKVVIEKVCMIEKNVTMILKATMIFWKVNNFNQLNQKSLKYHFYFRQPLSYIQYRDYDFSLDFLKNPLKPSLSLIYHRNLYSRSHIFTFCYILHFWSPWPEPPLTLKYHSKTELVYWFRHPFKTTHASPQLKSIPFVV